MATNMVIFKDLKTAELSSESTLQQGKIIFDLDSKTMSIDDYTTASPTSLVRIKMYEFIGTLTSLTTTAKDTIVNAVNEINTNIGSLNSLTTTIKTSIVNAINEVDLHTDNNTNLLGNSNIGDAQQTTVTGAIADLYDWSQLNYPDHLITNALLVDTTYKYSSTNKPGYVAQGLTTSNLPADCAYGTWRVNYVNGTSIMVIIEGTDISNRPSKWMNRYNGSTWTGWYREINSGNISEQSVSHALNSNDSVNANYISAYNPSTGNRFYTRGIGNLSADQDISLFYDSGQGKVGVYVGNVFKGYIPN